jgi:hypothetical protein
VPWIIVDVALALLSLVLLVVLCLQLWRRVKRLFRAMGVANDTVAQGQRTLDRLDRPRSPSA